MSLELLVPLGLIGLLGVVALIIIYLIRPNYMSMHISSTYVWKLSLRYRKKRLPTSRVRNILIFICQVLILTLIAGILSMPVLAYHSAERLDVIAIIDSSASMYAQSDGETRYSRAIRGIRDLSREVFEEGGNIFILLADGDPDFLEGRFSPDNSALLEDTLRKLEENTIPCSYGVSDISAAIRRCEEVINENPATRVYLYTDTDYLYIPETVNVIDVKDSRDWNVAILNAHAEIEDVYQVLTVEVASYGVDLELELRVDVSGADALNSSQAGENIVFSKLVDCSSNNVQTVVFRYGGGEDKENTTYYSLGDSERFQSYQSIHISIGEMDSFSADNSFDIYGGQKEVIRVQYASSRKLPTGQNDSENPGPNTFVIGSLSMLKNAFADNWDLEIKEVAQGQEPATEGFDLYIFEHDMPQILPTDGVIFLLDPDVGPSGSGFRVETVYDFSALHQYVTLMAANENHPVMSNPDSGYRIIADNISVSKYKVLNCDSAYEVLMTCDTNPILMVQKNEGAQIAVLAFSVHYSNIVRILEWPYLFYNLFDYYFPGTVDGYDFEVGEQITLNSRGAELTVSGCEEPFTQFPASVTLDVPGTYTIRQTSYYGKNSITDIFVKIPALESNIWREEDSLQGPNYPGDLQEKFDDLLIYLAAALTFLVFVERLLHVYEWRR